MGTIIIGTTTMMGNLVYHMDIYYPTSVMAEHYGGIAMGTLGTRRNRYYLLLPCGSSIKGYPYTVIALISLIYKTISIIILPVRISEYARPIIWSYYDVLWIHRVDSYGCLSLTTIFMGHICITVGKSETWYKEGTNINGIYVRIGKGEVGIIGDL